MAIEINPAHKGKLHRDLGIAAGKKIPMSELLQAKKSKSPAVRKEANFAVNARGWNK